MYGFMGRILRINLSTRRILKEKLSESDAKKYLGGRGLAIKILYSELQSGIDPLSRENKIVFAVGPTTATGIPGNSRFVVAAKSPLTGLWCDSNCGGFFAFDLKKAGYDALIVEGLADSPVYVNINNDEVEIRDADFLWGKMTLDTEKLIAKDLGIKKRRENNPSVACIGPAGEKHVKYASVMHTAHRAAGRGGLGAVMGSKKLKAITVKGTKEVQIADRTKLKKINKKTVSECKTFFSEFTAYGQAGFIPGLQAMGMLPTRNFQKGTFNGYEQLSGQTMAKTILKSKGTCADCPIACKREVEVNTGPYAPVDQEYGGPEYESIASLGSLLLIDDLAAVSKGNQLCNAYGLDTISTGSVIAFVMECYDRSILTSRDTDGIQVTWGNADAMLKLIKKIGEREGFGDLLSEGVLRYAQKIGKSSEGFCMHVKGMELPMHEPRAKKGLGLSYATSNRGGCHLQSFHDTDFEADNVAPEIGISKAIDRHDTSRRKVKIITKTQDWMAVINSLILCTSGPFWFGPNFARPEPVTEMFNTVTSWDLNVNDLMTVGERINNLCRCFNAREGVTRLDDDLPLRFKKDPLPNGLSKGQCLTQKELENMLDDYYTIRGWNLNTGIPTRQKLKKLNLEFAYIS